MIGAAIAAGASLAGSYMSHSAASDANKMQAEQARLNRESQEEFARKGIQWKTQDALKAGIHPLYALGAQTHSFSPVSVGSTIPDYSGISQAGQDIGRAIDSTRTATSRQGAYEKTMMDLQLQKVGLENELLASQVAKVKLQVGPPFPGDDYLLSGQTQSGVPLMHSARQPQFTPNLRAFGSDILPSHAFSDGQTFQDRYGEPGEWAAAMPIAVADWWRNVKPYLDRQLYDKLRR